MALNHGYDVTGQNVVILSIAKHRKDAKKAPMLRKWIAFSYEMHVSVGNAVVTSRQLPSNLMAH